MAPQSNTTNERLRRPLQPHTHSLDTTLRPRCLRYLPRLFSHAPTVLLNLTLHTSPRPLWARHLIDDIMWLRDLHPQRLAELPKHLDYIDATNDAFFTGAPQRCPHNMGCFRFDLALTVARPTHRRRPAPRRSLLPHYLHPLRSHYCPSCQAPAANKHLTVPTQTPPTTTYMTTPPNAEHPGDPLPTDADSVNTSPTVNAPHHSRLSLNIIGGRSRGTSHTHTTHCPFCLNEHQRSRLVHHLTHSGTVCLRYLIDHHSPHNRSNKCQRAARQTTQPDHTRATALPTPSTRLYGP